MPVYFSIGHWDCNITCALPVKFIEQKDGDVYLDAVFQNEVIKAGRDRSNLLTTSHIIPVSSSEGSVEIFSKK
jgi:hypothetical protein